MRRATSIDDLNELIEPALNYFDMRQRRGDNEYSFLIGDRSFSNRLARATPRPLDLQGAIEAIRLVDQQANSPRRLQGHERKRLAQAIVDLREQARNAYEPPTEVELASSLGLPPDDEFLTAADYDNGIAELDRQIAALDDDVPF